MKRSNLHIIFDPSRALFKIFSTPMCPKWTASVTLCRKSLGRTILCPLKILPPILVNSSLWFQYSNACLGDNFQLFGQPPCTSCATSYLNLMVSLRCCRNFIHPSAAHSTVWHYHVYMQVHACWQLWVCIRQKRLRQYIRNRNVLSRNVCLAKIIRLELK